MKRALLLCAACALATVGFGQGKIQLRFVVWDGDDALRAIREGISEFEQVHPNIHVKLENVNADYQEKLLLQIAADVAPDVAMMDPGNFQRFAKREAILPLNQFFGVDPTFDIHRYYKEIVDPHSYKGTLYVLPRDIAPMGIIYYNKRLFDEAGLAYPDGTWTWDFKIRPELREKDFIWVMQQLTKKDSTGRAYQWGYSAGLEDFAKMLYLSTGAQSADDNEAPTKVLMDDPRIVRAYQFAADLSLKDQFIPSPTEVSTVQQASEHLLFTQGRVGMFQSGIWDVPAMRLEIPKSGPGSFGWDIALAPSYADGTRGYPTGGSGYCILAQTKHPKEAWLLTEWMAGPPGMQAMARAGLAQPAIRDLALGEPWIPGPHTPAIQQVPHNRIVTDTAVPYVRFGPTADYWHDVNDDIAQVVPTIWDGTKTAKEALTIATRRAQLRLDRILQERELPAYNWTSGAVGGAGLVIAAGLWVYWPERKKRLSNRARKEALAAYVFIAPWLLGLLLLTLGPMIFSLLMSFSKWDVIRPAQWRGVGNFVEAFVQDPRFWSAVKVTLTYTIVALPLGLALSLALALLLNVKVRGIAFYRTCFYLPSLASAVAASLIWKKIFQADGGLINLIVYGWDGHGNFLGVATLLKPFATAHGQVNWLGNEKTALGSLIVMSLWGAGGGMIILLAGLQGIPQFYYEAATMDGASRWRQFRMVTLPLLSPSLFFSMVTGFIGAIQTFTSAYVATGGGPNDSTMFYALHLYKEGILAMRMGYASALAWILFVVVLAVTGFQFAASKWVYYESEAR